MAAGLGRDAMEWGRKNRATKNPWQFRGPDTDFRNRTNGEENCGKVLPLSSLSGGVRMPAKQSERGAARIRTGASRICNPLP